MFFFSEPAGSDNPVSVAKKELDELRDLLPEIKAKHEDALESKKAEPFTSEVCDDKTKEAVS